MADYTEYGYNDFFDSSIQTQANQLSQLDMDAILQSISAEKISGTGSIKTNDGNMIWNLDETTFTVSDGTIERVRLGKFEDNEYGLRIVDRDNNELVNITGNTNILKSADGKMQIDLANNQIRGYDDTNLRVLIGEL